jgi:hypothetical protein
MTDVKRELRLALGMRGGVSLAIWIGGACSEIDRVRRADTGRGDFSDRGDCSPRGGRRRRGRRCDRRADRMALTG